MPLFVERIAQRVAQQPTRGPFNRENGEAPKVKVSTDAEILVESLYLSLMDTLAFNSSNHTVQF